MAAMLASKPHVTLPWSQCHCGCLAGSKSRKGERRINRKVEARRVSREIREEMNR